ncbi:MAG: hypothetical protein GWP08_00495 [Nitrospiraceae bacterium]|nr:hypothetical protein [Nitrospiraceae bacterium]
MSGHIIVAPVCLADIEVASSLLASLTSGIESTEKCEELAAAVRELVALRAETAQEKAGKDKVRAAQWLDHQARQQRKMDLFRDIEAAIEGAEKRLSAAGLREARATATPITSAEQGFLTLGQHDKSEAAVRRLQDVTAIIDGLPPAIRDADGSPYPALVRQRQRLEERLAASGGLTSDDVQAFENVVGASFARFRQELDRRRETRLRVAARIETALDDVLLYEGLAYPEQQAELSALRGQLTALLNAEEILEGPLALFENRLKALKSAIDLAVVRGAHRSALCESITRNLRDMAYEEILAFPGDVSAGTQEAVLRIPGGELLHVTLQADDQAAFHVVHERRGADEHAPLTPQEWAHHNAQEARWCSDFKELLRRIVAEGFPYRVALEENVSEQSVKIVTVETADELLTREAEEQRERTDPPETRYLS